MPRPPFDSLAEFIDALDRMGELRRVRAPVSPVLEIAQIADLLSKTRAPTPASAHAQRTDPRNHHLGGPALLFERVEGCDHAVLINALGSYRRMALALGAEPEDVASRLSALTKPAPPQSVGDMLDAATRFAPLLRTPPRRLSGMGACQEVVREGAAIDLTRLPLLRCWPHDGDFASLGYPAGVNDAVPGLGAGEAWNAQHRGRYITLGGIHTIHASDAGVRAPASHNIGMYRVQLLGKRTLAMHWHMHHDGARHWRSWQRAGRPMPVAIALGGESVLPYAATAPLPPGMSELLLAGFLNGRGIPLVRAATVPLWVPANAEIIIEGFVRTDAGAPGWHPGTDEHDARRPREPLGPGAVFEGPFGDHTGFYSLPDRYPLLEVSAITHRRGAVFPATIVGLPPQEDYFMGKATERIFLPLLRTVVHDIEDYDLPMCGAFHNCACVAIRKEYPLQARRVMHSVWGAGQMAWTKCVIVVDDGAEGGVDVHDVCAVLRAVGERCVPGRDIEVAHGPLDILDHAAPFLGAGAKLGIDATRKKFDAELHAPCEAEKAALRAQACATSSVGPVLADAAARVEERVARLEGVRGVHVPPELGGWWMFVQVDTVRTSGQEVIRALGPLPSEVALPAWIVVVGMDADITRTDDALFHLFAHCAPERDHVLSVCGRRVAFDATPKREGVGRLGLPVRQYPPILRMNSDVVARVRGRWSEYGLGEYPG